MDKTLDTLNFYFRTLVVISASVLTLAVGQIVAKSNRTNDQAQIAKTADIAFTQFSGDIRARATASYRKMFLSAIARASPAVKEAVAQVQFTPVMVTVRQRSDGAGLQALNLPLKTSVQAATLFQLAQLFGWPDPIGSYPDVGFRPEVIRSLIDEIEGDEFRSLLYGGDLLIVIAPPLGRGEPCELYLESPKWAAARQPRRLRVTCELLDDPIDISDNVAGFVPSAPLAAAFEPGILMLTPEAAIAHLTEQDKAARDKPEPVDLGGPKVDPKLALQIAPLLLVILLLLMMGPMRTAARLAKHEPLDGGFWFGQFLGLPAWVIFTPFVVLPAGAAFASAGLAHTFNHPGAEAVIAGLVVLALAAALFGLNVHEARAWRVRMDKALPVQSDHAALDTSS